MEITDGWSRKEKSQELFDIQQGQGQPGFGDPGGNEYANLGAVENLNESQII